MDRGWVQSMQNVDNIYIITEGGPKETKYLPTRESTTSLNRKRSPETRKGASGSGRGIIPRGFRLCLLRRKF